MSSWMNEPAVPNHNGNGFPQIPDPSAVPGAMMDPSAFMANPAQFNPQFASPQQMMALQNGQMRNASPALSNPVYQTNSVVPSKRPRPREDSIGQSPRQAPGMLPTSRAETPQQATFPGFPQGGLPQQSSGQPSPYPHLQPNGSANATPSPIMANQMRPGSVPQRVSTTSPHPFSPAAQQFPQASPIPSDHANTPQPNPYMQQNNFPPGFNPQFAQTQSPARPTPTPNPMAGQMMPQQMGQTPQQLGQMQNQMQQMQGQMQGQMPGQMSGQLPGQMPGQVPGPGPGPNQMANQMFPQGMPQARNAVEQQKMFYQLQLQQQLARNNMQMPGQNIAQAQAQAQMQAQIQAQAQSQAQAQAQARNMMAARQGVPNGQMPTNAMRQQQQAMQQQAMQQQGMQQQQAAAARGQNPDQFLKNLNAFMANKQLPFEMHPTVEGRPVNLMLLFQAVTKFQGYRNVTQGNGWPQISQALGFPPQHVPSAPQQLKSIYERSLLKFEEAWMAQQNRARMQQQGMQPGMPNKAMPQGQMSPGQMLQASPQQMQQMQHMQQMQQAQMQQAHVQTPVKPSMGQPQPGINGYSTPQPHPQAGVAPGHTRNSHSRSVQATPTADEFAIPSPAHRKPGSMSLPGTAHPDSAPDVGATFPAAPTADPDVYVPCVREVTTYGGIELGPVIEQGGKLERLKPDLPPVMELGNIDIQALTRSIQSGIHAEVRVALDTLALVTSGRPADIPISLRHSDDLVETLIDCAEIQVDPLAEDTVEVSDEILITSFEEVIRSCKLEKMSIRDIPALGTPEYELDRCVDRLICITTILRNLSFFPDNQKLLADETVVEFLCVIIRYLGTRNMLLRTHSNTLDFMKDVIIFLSNIAAEVEIPGREQAYCLLQFLLAFAPSPPATWAGDQLFFTPYEPSLQPYLAHAVDALAKLFARDEPNRTHYKALLAADASATTSSVPYELLTRTFGLAICVVPEQFHEGRRVNPVNLVMARKPLLMQGLLAADILASLVPNNETGVARTWLSSGNGLAQNLYHLAHALVIDFEGQARRAGAVMGPQARNQVPPKKDTDLVYIASLAVNLVKRLCDKARDPNEKSGVPASALPDEELVLQILSLHAREWTERGMLADLVACAKLGS